MANVPYSILIKYVDIGAVINALEIEVSKITGRSIICQCIMPKHRDSTPSMHIDKKTGIYYCFGCREKGTLLKAITIVNGMEYPENKLYLESFSNIHNISMRDIIDDIDRDKEPDAEQSDVLVKGYRRNYSAESINTKPVYYPMGTDSWSAEVYEWCERALIKYNIVKPYFNLGYCRVGKYKDRIIIPVWFKGKLVDFQARAVNKETEPKDLFIYGIPVGVFLFNYDNINWDYAVCIVEGAVDVLRLWPYSTNCVAALGSYLCEPQAELLKRSKSLITLPDNDMGGLSLLNSIKSQLNGMELWLRYFDKKDIPNLLKKVVKVNG